MRNVSSGCGIALFAVLLAGAPYASGQTADKKPLTEAKAKDLIEHGTQVKGCGGEAYTFQSVQIGQAVKQKDGGQKFELTRCMRAMPSHASTAMKRCVQR